MGPVRWEGSPFTETSRLFHSSPIRSPRRALTALLALMLLAAVLALAPPTDPVAAANDGSRILVRARGATGAEILEVYIDTDLVRSWNITDTDANYFFVHSETVDAGQIRVRFANNDVEVPGGGDPGIYVDKLKVDGVVYESEAPTTFSTGSWNGSDCGPGFNSTELLACTGFFTYAPRPDLGGYVVEEYITGLTIPWDIVFADDGTMIYNERPGRLWARLPDGTTNVMRRGMRDLSSTDFTDGLLGMALDPKFTQNRRLYTCQTHIDETQPVDEQLSVHVITWFVNRAYTRVKRIADPLIEIPVDGTRHSGCRLIFDRGNRLMVAVGDGLIGTAPQDTSDPAGKVLRIKRATGTGSIHNPFFAGGDPVEQMVFSYGHRNPQGLAMHPETRDIWLAEHGPDYDDEVNRLEWGGNYGWDPEAEPGAPTEFPGYDETTTPMTDTVRFPDAIEAAWSSGAPTRAPSGIAFIEGEEWGDADGALAIAFLKNSALHLMHFDDDGNFERSEILPELDAVYGRLRSPIMGPDGALYVTTSNGTKRAGADMILRITPAPAV